MTWIKAIVIAWFSLLFGASALASPRKPSVLYIHSDTAAPASDSMCRTSPWRSRTIG